MKAQAQALWARRAWVSLTNESNAEGVLYIDLKYLEYQRLQYTPRFQRVGLIQYTQAQRAFSALSLGCQIPALQAEKATVIELLLCQKNHGILEEK